MDQPHLTSLDADTRPASRATGSGTSPSAQPLVSVLMVTYNHDRFVAQAIESVLMQRTQFPFELVIGEDCSTDGTTAIVEDYARRNPERIRVFLREKNLGCVGPDRNLIHTLDACRGMYIAWLDGDDFWISPDKLQRQADWLDAHPSCVQCFHAVDTQVEVEGQIVRQWTTRPNRSYARLQDHLRGSFILPCSVMFRRGLFTHFPDWYFTLWTDDWPLFMLNAQYGRTGYLDEVMAVYRIHADGWWQRLNRIDRQLKSLEVYRAMDRHFDGQYSGIIQAGEAHCQFELAMAYENAGNTQQAAKHARIALQLRPRGGWKSAAQLCRVLCRAWTPNFYVRVRSAWRKHARRATGDDQVHSNRFPDGTAVSTDGSIETTSSPDRSRAS
jgi:glycosyltransferase involved in cell wall biosynthesis